MGVAPGEVASPAPGGAEAPGTKEVELKPRLVVDATSISPGGKGISRVQRDTVRALAALNRYDLRVHVASDVDVGLPARRVRRRPALVREQLTLARAARTADAVLTWTDRLPLIGADRCVVWLFEVPTHRIDQNTRSRAGAYQRGSDAVTSALWRRSLRRAGRVLAGSGATAADLASELPGVETRVVYPGLAEWFTPGPGRSGRYLFHLASTDPRDNTAGVLEAVELANERLRERVTLVVAGSVSIDPSPHVEAIGRVSDEVLVSLYRGAAAYLDASLYEGFGYQPLEAMACGAPVIASETPAAEETLRDAAILCEPADVAARAAAIVRVLEEPGLAKDLRARGFARSARFTWERTTADLVAAIDEVAL